MRSLITCVLLAAAGLSSLSAADGMDELGDKSEKTPTAKAFSSTQSKKIASLKDGGFVEEPALHDSFDSGWPARKQHWIVASWKQNKTQMSPKRCTTNDEGHLVQTVLPGLPGQGGSMQTKQEFGYGRWVARLKPSAVPGVLNSMFTKDWDDMTTAKPGNDGDKGEVDIELLSHTYGPDKGEAHLAIHLKEHHPLWHLDIPLDFNPSDEFHEWGFDILPDKIVWHVDGRVLHEWAYTEKHRINPGYEFFFNSWTMKKWIKGPPQKKADYKIDWVKFYPLTSD